MIQKSPFSFQNLLKLSFLLVFFPFLVSGAVTKDIHAFADPSDGLYTFKNVDDNNWGTLTFGSGWGNVNEVPNNPPIVNLNSGLTVKEGQTTNLNSGILHVDDIEDSEDVDLTFTVTSATANGILFMDANGNNTFDSGETRLGVSATFTQDDVNNYKIRYASTTDNDTSDDFKFTLSDTDGGQLTDQTFYITITPVNDAPVASNVNVTGTLQVGEVLTATYNYADMENDSQNGSSYKWYRSNDASGTNKTAISGATTSSYTLVIADRDKYINFEVTPNDGTDTGTAVESSLQGPIVNIAVPVLTNIIVSNLLGTTATFSGEITSDGGATVTERGFVYNTTGNPTTAGTKVQSGSGPGIFEEDITSLTKNTTYHVRAYAINEAGTAYGAEKTFTTYKEPEFNSTAVTEVEYDHSYFYSIAASLEGDMETTLSATTVPEWLSFSLDGQNGATLFGNISSEVYLSGVAGDGNGNIYAIRYDGTEIFKIAPDGTTTSWKSGLISGNVYALHISNGYIYIPRYSNATNSLTRIPLSDPSAAEENFFATAGGILSLTDKDGFIYATNYIGREILKINETTKASEVILDSNDGIPSGGPFGIALDDGDNLYIATYGNRSIMKYDGTTLTSVLSDLPAAATSVKLDAKGNFYLSMAGGGVRKYDAAWSGFETVSQTATDDIWSLSFTASGALVYAVFASNQVYRLQTGAVLSGTPAKSDVGDHEVVLEATNAAGNSTQFFTIHVVDKTGPVVQSFAPVDQATDIALKPTLSLTFDEAVSLNTTGTVTLEDNEGVVQTYDLSVQEDLEKFVLSEDKLTLSLTVDQNLPVNTELSVGIGNGLVKDKYNNAFSELDASTNTWTFTTINKLDQTITFSAIAEKTYGDPTFSLGNEKTDQDLAVTYTAQDPTVVSISGNQATILKAGTTEITATQEGDATHFAATPVIQNLAVGKVAITVTPDARTKVYGEVDPALTYEISSGALIGSEAFSGTLTREAGEDVGNYEIELGTLALNSNYELTYKSKDLAITKAVLTVTANAVNKIYDGTPAAEVSLSGNRIGDDELTVTYSNAVFDTENVGIGKTVNVSGIDISGADADNYSVSTTATTTADITPADQRITFDAIPPKHLEVDPNFQLGATTSSGLPISYTYSYTGDKASATISESGYVTLISSGKVEITASQEGDNNYLPATSVIRTLTIDSQDAFVHSLVINGEVYNEPANEIYYLIGCGDSAASMNVLVDTEANASVTPSREFQIATPVPGIYRQDMTVASQDGSISETYHITVEKRFDFKEIVKQKFNNVLLVNNNPETNGGYQFASYEWYKNGMPVGTGQYYSAGPNATDLLDMDADYHVKMVTVDGQTLQTCTFRAQMENSFEMKAYPNPVVAGGSLEILADLPQAELATMQISIYAFSGELLKQVGSQSKITKIDVGYLPSGTYLVVANTNGREKSFKIIIR